MDKTLSEYFSPKRRYLRSINLERDLNQTTSLDGYILTECSTDVLKRITHSLVTPDSNRAWTLTGVYGTGKSSFAQYLTALLAPESSSVKQLALKIAKTALGAPSAEYQGLVENLSKRFICAVATAQREPISHTVIRALRGGIQQFQLGQVKWKNLAAKLTDLEIETGHAQSVSSGQVVDLVVELAQIANTGIFIILDELGKTLEFAAYNEGAEDLFLLQQLAELPKNQGTEVYLLGLLHQSFTDYGQRLATIQRNEWGKIQGRFEDLSFNSSVGQTIHLIGQAINVQKSKPLTKLLADYAKEWHVRIRQFVIMEDLTADRIKAIYPLHPLSALVLPTLCTRYAQNDRSLFTFLTSAEPFSLKNYLDETKIGKTALPTLKLDRIYDYFIESVRSSLVSRPNLKRWFEIQTIIDDANDLDEPTLQVLKAIGILNLVTTTGSLRATPELVKLALCDRPSDAEQQGYWQSIIDVLIKERRRVTYRKQINELRIWEGSDFDFEEAIRDQSDQDRRPLAELLTEFQPLSPMVAQSHSYRTGTLRYFERTYVDQEISLGSLSCQSEGSDGLLVYWLGEYDLDPDYVPTATVDGRPLVVLCGNKLGILRSRARELAALRHIQKQSNQLKSDGVARRELQHRLSYAKQLLDESFNYSFKPSTQESRCWVWGKSVQLGSIADLNTQLSVLCDRVYSQTPVLWNELINRRELTNQGARARRRLIEAMLGKPDQPKLGLQGYGPEVSMYFSILEKSGIHRQEGEWGIYPPRQESDLENVWKKIEGFCLGAKEKPRTLDSLYQELYSPPYGMREGAIPIMLAAVLLHHTDDVGLYKDGTFIPVLGPEHFEILVKAPDRFAVKSFAMMGLRSQVFRELEAILRNRNAKTQSGVRNVSLLSVSKPLFQFVKRLPPYTGQAKRISPEARNVLLALKSAKEPDELLFVALPQALGMEPISEAGDNHKAIAETLRKKLVQALQELNTAYDNLLGDCQSLLHNAFGVRMEPSKLREDLRVRASYLLGICLEPTLNRFSRAAVDEQGEMREWLESLVMVVADKPANSWTDEDTTAFEVKLSALARRFKNLEALQKDADAPQKAGFEARRVTITQPSGEEVHQLIWFDQDVEKAVSGYMEKIEKILGGCQNPQVRQALVAILAEKVLKSHDGVAGTTPLPVGRPQDGRKRQAYTGTVGGQG